MLGFVSQSARWIWPEADEVLVERLREDLAISALTAAVLVRRGITDAETASHFLNPSFDDFHDPRLLPDYRQAVDAILAARDKDQIIAVHGDYDVDGVTSAALFTRFLRRIGCKIAPHVPHRIREGYGIHLDAVEWAKQQGASVFLTCDCGIKAFEQIEAVRAAGMIPVVTDHHTVGHDLPDAAAIVNPHRADSQYPFAELSGVGVVLKLCAGITEEIGHKPTSFYRAYLDLAVLGTVADVMPLTGENRTIVALGLPSLLETKKEGLRALIEISDLSSARRITSRDIGFRLGPRINAAGRIDDSAIAFELLMTDDPQRARQIAQQLDDINTDRRLQQGKAFEEAVEMVTSTEADRYNVIVVASKSWHPGLVGIVAGKLVERFRRPSFVGAINDKGIAKTSARSISGFDLERALHVSEDLHLGGGGHELAAGLSIEEDKIGAFIKRLHEHANSVLTPEDYLPKVTIDAVATTEDCTLDRLREVRAMEPFGNMNPEPVLGLRGVSITKVTPTSKPEHVRLSVKGGAKVTEVMGFNMADTVRALPLDQPVDLAVRLSENVYRGETSLTVSLDAIRTSP